MDAEQESRENPFGMDEECRNCPALCETRERVVHGYGDVGADFLFLGHAPDAAAEAAGVPFAGREEPGVLDVLAGFDMCEDPTATPPAVSNAYLTYVARCRHPDRDPTDEEVRNCEPYLNGEVRMINPEIIVPVGQRALEALAFEYTTLSVDELDVRDRHATTIRGRGFEIVPTLPPADSSDDEFDRFREHFADVLGRDYRQTKGRRGR